MELYLTVLVGLILRFNSPACGGDCVEHLPVCASVSPRHEPVLPAFLPAQRVRQSPVREAGRDGAGRALRVPGVLPRPHHVPGPEEPHPGPVVHQLQSKCRAWEPSARDRDSREREEPRRPWIDLSTRVSPPQQRWKFWGESLCVRGWPVHYSVFSCILGLFAF